LLDAAFPTHAASLISVLNAWRTTWTDIEARGKNLSRPTKALADAFNAAGWVEQAFDLQISLNGVPTGGRSHKVDHFRSKATHDPFPGVAVDVEWSNKDEFFDRDLINFEALHRARGIAVGVLICRSAPLHQEMVRRFGGQRFGARTTHWDKLMPRLDLGRGGATPIIAIGIGLGRVR
jgi:Restriction endonuclease BglII